MSKDRALLGLKRKDKETGLHYNRYRYYEPFSARYISKDPIGLDGGLNNSVYVSDPNQWVDPMGLMAKSEKEKMAANNASVLKNKANETQLAKSKWGVTKVSDYWIGQQKIYNQPVPKNKKEPYSGGLLGGYKIPSKYNDNKSKCPSGKCNIEIDYLICAGSYYVGSGSVGLNVHNGNIYGGIGITKASYDKLSGKSAIGAGCLGFSLGQLDSKLNRATLTDSAMTGESFGLSYGGPFGLAAGVDMPIAKGGKIAVNTGGGFSTPGVTYFDFSHSKHIGNTKDTEPYAIGLMRSFGGL